MEKANSNNIAYGYMRLSKKSKNVKDGKPLTTDEELARQKQLLVSYGVPESNILSDGIVSGMKESRPVLNQILGWNEYQEQGSCLSKGTTLVVCEYSRLSRDFDMLKKITDRLLQLEVNLIVLDFPMLCENLSTGDNITTKLINTVVRDVLIYVAAQEREYISNRTKQALALKREQGCILGRPKIKVSQELLDKVYNLYYTKREINSQDAMKMLGMKRSTFFNIMKSEKERRFKELVSKETARQPVVTK